jgi:hypothetical protein
MTIALMLCEEAESVKSSRSGVIEYEVRGTEYKVWAFFTHGHIIIHPSESSDFLPICVRQLNETSCLFLNPPFKHSRVSFVPFAPTSCFCCIAPSQFSCSVDFDRHQTRLQSL